MSNKKCAHAPCRCLARPNERYCSEYCEMIQFVKVEVHPPQPADAKADRSKLKCGCGHVNCAMLH